MSPATLLTFTLSFNQPFRSGSGRAARGLDSTVDEMALVQASGVKGLMRVEARRLGTPRQLVDEIFGTPKQPSPWHWDVRTAGGLQLVSRTRVRIDPSTGTAMPGALRAEEAVDQVGGSSEAHAHLTITWKGTDGGRLQADRNDHEAVLVCSALSVIALGADRRRGLGWVDIQPVQPADAADHIDRFDALLEAVTR